MNPSASPFAPSGLPPDGGVYLVEFQRHDLLPDVPILLQMIRGPRRGVFFQEVSSPVLGEIMIVSPGKRNPPVTSVQQTKPPLELGGDVMDPNRVVQVQRFGVEEFHVGVTGGPSLVRHMHPDGGLESRGEPRPWPRSSAGARG